MRWRKNVGKQYLNGGYAEFIEEMNRISQELGCTSSNWVNANGLHDDNHYTTAHDMARIAAAAIRMKSFEDWRQRWNTKFHRRI